MLNRGTRRVGALLVSLSVLAACGGADEPSTAPSSRSSSQPSTPTPTSAPSPYTERILAAALPTKKDLPDDYRILVSCPGDDESCGGDNPNASIFGNVKNDQNIFAVGVTEYKDASKATTQLETSRSGWIEMDGSFDIPPEKLPNGETADAKRGTGELEDANVEGWRGFRFIGTYQTESANGTAGGTTSEGYVVLVRGGTMASVQVVVSGTDEGLVSQRLDEHMRFVLARL